MQTKPKVSIVIIAYNEERFIKEAIESALDQNYENTEVILVDDGSKDKTVAIAKQFEPNVKVISQKNSGNCSFPRNAGLAIATGEYVSFLDGDDILLPNKISEQVAILQRYPEAALVVSNYCNFKGDEEQNDHFSNCPRLSSGFARLGSETILLVAGTSADIMLEENFTIASSPLFRMDRVRMLGGFRTELCACEDYHLNYRLGMEFPIVVNKQVLFKRRLHDANMSSNTLKMGRFYYLSRWFLYKEEIDADRKKRLEVIVKRNLMRFIKLAIKSKNLRGIKESIIGYFKLLID